MIKQKYNYSFFYDNYNYSKTMYNKYCKGLEDKYRYAIMIRKDINVHKVEIYRSNSSLDDIFNQLRDVEFQEASIKDFRVKFPDPIRYVYNKFEDKEWIVTEYYTDRGLTAKYREDKLIYKYWNCYKPICAARLSSEGDLYVSIKGYDMYYYKENDEIKIHKSVPLSPGYYEKYNREHMEMIEKVIKKLMKDNISGFYNDMIESIKNNFGIR